MVLKGVRVTSITTSGVEVRYSLIVLGVEFELEGSPTLAAESGTAPRCFAYGAYLLQRDVEARSSVGDVFDLFGKVAHLGQLVVVACFSEARANAFDITKERSM
jgi:hypothetical protein